MSSRKAFAALPASLAAERRGNVAVLKLNRPHKRNALDDETILGIEAFFTSLPDDIGAVLLHGEGEHFSAGLDLTELEERDVTQGIAHSGLWHRAFEKIQFGKAPVVAVLHGAVVGGGLELAAAAHVRVAERSAYYALPEGSRGIYVGGGGSVRLPRLIGVARMMDMMLTGRTYSAEEGQAMGLTTYLVEPGQGLRQRPRTRRTHRRQHQAHQFRGHARAAAHRRERSGRGLRHGGADVVDRAGRRRGQGAAQGVPGKTRAQSDAVADGRPRQRETDAVRRAAARGRNWAPSMPCSNAASNGVIHLRTAQVLPPYHATLSEPLDHWAKAAPERVFLAGTRPARRAGAG